MIFFEEPSQLLFAHVFNSLDHSPDMIAVCHVTWRLAQENIADFKEFIVLEICKFIFGGLLLF